MITYTDTQLRQALAKMLPETLHIAEGTTDCLKWSENKNYPRNVVLDAELLHLCWLVEETLNYEEKDAFSYQLYKNDGFYSCVDSEGNDDWNEVFKYAHATWQQRVIALAKVKGIEL